MTIKIGTKTIASKVFNSSWGSVEGNITDQVDLKNALNQKAPIHSPQFSGTPLAPSLTNDSNKLQITNKEYVDTTIQTAIDNVKIDETNLVHKDGTETITGAKTFNTHVTMGNSALGSYKDIQGMSEINGKRIGGLRFQNGSDGVTRTTQIYVADNTNANKGGVIVGIDANNTVYTSAVTPIASSNSTHIATTAWVNTKIGSDTRIVHTTGNETIKGVKTFTEVIQGTAYSAYWGDLAEFYESDNEYPKGTLVKFGGEKEITIANDEVNAVITSEPGFILNRQMENGQPIALCGRVPVRVIGKVNKFDYLTLSDIPGVARAREVNDICSFTARALEQKESEEEGLILCVVRFNP